MGYYRFSQFGNGPYIYTVKEPDEVKSIIENTFKELGFDMTRFQVNIAVGYIARDNAIFYDVIINQ